MKKILTAFLILIAFQIQAQKSGYNAYKLRLAEGTGLTERLSTVKEDGRIWYLNNGSEGDFLKIKNGIPTYSIENVVTSFSSGGLSNLFLTEVQNSTSTPNLVFSPISQNKNLMFASPNDSSGMPTFRAIVNNDLPQISVTKFNYGINASSSTYLRGDGTWGADAYVLPTASTTILGGVKIDGTSITITNGVISAPTSGGGTVVAVTGVAPITSTGGVSPAIGITAATTSDAGSMSAADKTKLNGIEAGANYYGGWNLYTPNSGYQLVGAAQNVTFKNGTNMNIVKSGVEYTFNATGGNGTVTSVSGTGTVSGLTLSGTVTTSGSLTLGGTLIETDPTVYAWAKATTKPTYTFAEITSTPTTLGGYGITDAQSFITAGTTSQYWRGDKTWQTLNTSVVTELTNLYYTDARSRAAISLTTTGTSGAATYSSSTGVLNVPNYASGSSVSVNGVSVSNPNFVNSGSIGFVNTFGSNVEAFIIGTGGGMVYPGAGIPLSTGTAWGTSITNNSENWNTAFGWGNHAIAGYASAGVNYLVGTADATLTNEIVVGTSPGGILGGTWATPTLDNYSVTQAMLATYTQATPSQGTFLTYGALGMDWGSLPIANAGGTQGIATFTANDFNSSAGTISIDYTNGQAAATGTKGFLTSTDWNTFNGKVGGSGVSGRVAYWSGTGTITSSAAFTFDGLNLRVGSTNGTGNVSSGNFTLSSDIRLKENIKRLENLDWVDKINFYNFNYKKDLTKTKRFGVIAQEVEKVQPDLVKIQDGVKTVSYIDLLITKVARQDEIINKLIERLEKLENEK